MKRPDASSASPPSRTRTRSAVPAEPRSAPPQQVVIAARLMYAGAALSVATLVTKLLTTHGLRAAIISAAHKQHKHLTAAQATGTEHLLVGTAIFWGLFGTGLWLLMARANRNGFKWARIAASVLFGLNTVGLAGSFSQGSTNTYPAALISLALAVVIWLIGLGAIGLLWRPQSSDYFS